MSDTVKGLDKQANFLFNKKKPFDSLCQDLAENFYPERADFTSGKHIGSELAQGLTTSFPVTARRDLANMFSTMLRPSDKQWFFTRTRNMESVDHDGKVWLEWATNVQGRAMYDPMSNFIRTTKEADNDYAAFGQAVVYCDYYRKNNALLYRNYHLRDVAWCEGVDGKVDTVYRNDKMSAINLYRFFGDRVHLKVKEALSKDPYMEFNIRHCVMPSDAYGENSVTKKFKTPFISVYYDVDNQHLMEEVGSWTLKYVVPRWQLVSGSQYAYSPATVAALGDARLIQAMTLTLLEAGEKAVNPPMIAVQDAIRSDVAVYAGGITWVDAEYDERLGGVLRPLAQDKTGMPLGVEMQRDVRASIAEAFYLNKIGLPTMGKEMTAFEVGQRVSEYVRNALPLFEPMETEYNGALCEMTFDILMRNGAFGSMSDVPKSLRGQDINFIFESPLREAKDHQKGQRFLETKNMLAQAVEIDPSARNMVDVKVALRDVLESMGSPQIWLRSAEALQEIEVQEKQNMQMQQMMAQVQQGGEAVEQAAKAGKSLQELGIE
jgi:hypothetical protein